MSCTFGELFLWLSQQCDVSHSFWPRLKQEDKIANLNLPIAIAIASEIRAQWHEANSMSGEKNEAMHPDLDERGAGEERAGGHRREGCVKPA